MKNRIRFIVSICLLIITIIFIWSNSAESGVKSSEKSSRIVDFIKPTLDRNDNIPYEQFEIIIRKGAHFLEFAVLGAELSISYIFGALLKNKKHNNKAIIMIIPAFFIAFADELIQLTSDGRACRFSDIIIDTSGALLGILIILLISELLIKNNNKH